MNNNQIYIGKNKLNNDVSEVENNFVEINNEVFNKISNIDKMRPFFMSIVSNSNHWMFISSNGGLTAGRKDCDLALFPYYTDDKITESSEITGSKTLFQIHKSSKTFLWEPFSDKNNGSYKISRNLYKSVYNNKIIFEEINKDLNLTYSYEWNFSNLFGFIKKSKIVNNTNQVVQISVVDGLQNIIPYGVSADLQNSKSNLVDAYKKNERIDNLGIFSLSSMIIDRAEPSEALKASTVWSLGLENSNYLLSSTQLLKFRKGSSIFSEDCVKGEKGAFFCHSNFELKSQAEKKWLFVANVNQNHPNIVTILEQLKEPEILIKKLEESIKLGTLELISLVAASDGIQLSSDKLMNARHFSNVLFNIMRGGIFDNNYSVDKEDFIKYISKANKNVFIDTKNQLTKLTTTFSYDELISIANKSTSYNFKRLCFEYLPLKFSRRHGDPSRPWNKFLINTHNENDGSKILDYQGNWRDIFQNWEALAYSYPYFIEGMIFKFLNASTFDGYNPYRVTKDGFDWETVEPNDPWTYIGYWGDHQIIYLLKLLEICEKYYPNKISTLFNKSIFVYANVPYTIKSYDEILEDPKNTIDFDDELHTKILQEKIKIGADGALLKTENNSIYNVNLIEKLLAIVLSKFSNFVPEAGIWMNTQRPEWNDANNALVGNGTSMVTLYYLRRFLNFIKEIIIKTEAGKFEISIELNVLFNEISKVFRGYKKLLASSFSDEDRKSFLDIIGESAGNFRSTIYKNGFSAKKSELQKEEILDFVDIALDYLNHSIQKNKRKDNLYHSYNLITIKNKQVSINYLNEMLEGQVAVLTSGYLSANESLTLLNSLEKSSLYRKDIESYILYPNKDLLSFIDKNKISQTDINSSKLLQKLLKDGNKQIVVSDNLGTVYFNAIFNNVSYLKNELSKLPKSYNILIEEEQNLLFDIYENVFNHKYFTGRSGSFFGYEGLGSIYWHMVSKLALSAQEVCLNSLETSEDESINKQLFNHYTKIKDGLGIHKSPKVYGAFTTDPYSHTPAGRGAQQPGMTGQVKEDILNRFFELGVFVNKGIIEFKPNLLRVEEFVTGRITFKYFDVNSNPQELILEPNSLAFTYCQVPIIYQLSSIEKISISFINSSEITLNELKLSDDISKKIFERTGEISKIVVNVSQEKLI